ncbi:MAG: 50S ribosomal protein L11 methyltransferase [bacterium]
MKWLETRVNYTCTDRECAADLISNVFYELGLQGVVIENAKDGETAGRKHRDQGISGHDAVIAYLPINGDIGAQVRLAREGLNLLGKRLDMQYRITFRAVDEEDWAESWKAYFRPQRISGRIVVSPTWMAYDPAPRDIVVSIDPGMAFGTGTHPSTRLCVTLVERYLHKGDSVLDVGTGSGILLIVAAKLGAGKGLGIDSDQVAVDVAGENLSLNRICSGCFRIQRGDLLDGVQDVFDMVVANITSEVIDALIPRLHSVLRPGGMFICSGIVEENQGMIADRLLGAGFEVMETASQEGWTATAAKEQNGVRS